MAISRQQMINEALSHREIFNEFCASVDFKTEQTKKTYISILSRYINYLEEKRIEKPRESAVMTYKDYLRKERHNSGATLQLTNIVLRKFYRWTERLEYYPNLAVDLISENVTPTFKRQALTIDEANLLLDYAAEESTKGIVELRNYTFIYLILNIGLRTIEVSRADIEDIKKEGEFTYLYVQGKGHTDKDDPIRLDSNVQAVLEEYISKRKVKEGPLFINHGHRKAKERITSKTVSICIKKCLKAVGLDSRDITAHSLRHTCATIAISKGASYEEVKQLLRHKNINTTMIYNHTVNKMNNRSQSLVGEVLHTKK